MRVFLTGANGYLGSLLIERLAQLPTVESITGIGLSGQNRALPQKAKFVRMDIRSSDLEKAMAGHDVVVHTACVVLWPAKMSVQERDGTNIEGTRKVALAARKNNVRRFVHASSMAAYDPELLRGKTEVTEDFPIGNGDSSYYYWNSKAVAERILTEILSASGILTFLRPIYIIGPRNQKVVESYRKNALMFPGKNPRRQFIHEEDVAAAFVQAVQTDMQGSFNLVPDDFMRLSDLWKIVDAKFVPTLPLWLANFIVTVKWRNLGSPIHRSWVEDMLLDFTASNAKLKATGWKPNYSSEGALRSACDDCADLKNYPASVEIDLNRG